jgi:hypothetical protein
MLFLRTVKLDGSSINEKSNGFKWPLEVGAIVEAPDWDPTDRCGGGLHGLPWGEGEARLLLWEESKWLVFEAPDDSVVHITQGGGGKSKVPKATVVHVGDQKTATQYLLEHGGYGHAIVGLIAACGHNERIVGGDRCHLTGGDYAKVTGGDHATVTGGDCAKVTGGNDATVTGGNDATVTGGNNATVTGGHDAKVTGGHDAKVTGGNNATVTGGNGAKVTGGNDATVTGGNDATVTGGNDAKVTGGNYAKVTGGDAAKVTGGNYAKVTGGDAAQLRCEWHDGKRYRTAVAYVGEDVEAGVTYRVENGKFVKV